MLYVYVSNITLYINEEVLFNSIRLLFFAERRCLTFFSHFCVLLLSARTFRFLLPRGKSLLSGQNKTTRTCDEFHRLMYRNKSLQSQTLRRNSACWDSQRDAVCKG